MLRTIVAAIRQNWRSLRTQLALLYAGAFVALGAAVLGVLAVAGLLVRSGSTNVQGISSSHNFFAGRQFRVGPALVFGAAVLMALAIGWLIAGRILRPLRTITAPAREISASNLGRPLSVAGRGVQLAPPRDPTDRTLGR